MVQNSIGELASHAHEKGTMEITGTINTFLYDMYASGVFELGWNYSGGLSSHSSHYGGQLNFRASKNWTGETSLVGANSPHNNLSPFLAVFCWKRII